MQADLAFAGSADTCSPRLTKLYGKDCGGGIDMHPEWEKCYNRVRFEEVICMEAVCRREKEQMIIGEKLNIDLSVDIFCGQGDE
jgi:hypothetical protein